VRNTLERRRSSWIIEITNLDHLRRLGEWRRVIDFAGRDSDQFSDRGRYWRRPRPCIFGATTEADDGLPARADAPEWYFVPCRAIDVEALIRDHNQIWAEALVRYGARPGALVPGPPDMIGEMVPRDNGGIGGIQDEVAVLRRYLGERCEIAASSMITKDALCADYNRWRRVCGLPPINKLWLGRRLKRACPGLHDYRPDLRPSEERRQHYYRGLRVISGGRT
jgi:hypothetical protein